MSRLKRIEATLIKAEFATGQSVLRMVARIEAGRQRLIKKYGIEYVERIEKEAIDA